jgi:hypothetical protein
MAPVPELLESHHITFSLFYEYEIHPFALSEERRFIKAFKNNYYREYFRIREVA